MDSESLLSSEDKIQINFEIAKQAVKELEIPDISTFEENTLINQSVSLFYEETNKDIFLFGVLGGINQGSVKLSLTLIANNIFDETSRISNSKIVKQLEEIDSLDGIKEESLIILKRFIFRFRQIIDYSVYQSLNDAFVNYFKQIVEPNLRKEFNVNRLPKYLSSLFDDNSKNIIKLASDVELPLFKLIESKKKEFQESTQQFTGGLKKLLTKENKQYWKNRHEELRSQYTEAKKLYNSNRKQFFKNNKRNVTEDDWAKAWKGITEKLFPDLTLIEDINNYHASVLAYQQLANSLSINWEELKRKLGKGKGSL